MIKDIDQVSAVVSQPHRLPAYQKAGYALGIHGIMYFWYATNLFLFYFYTDVVGLTPAQTGTIFLISLFWDGITDPIMGAITDRIVARGGRYRSLVLIGGIPFCFSFVAIFYVPPSVNPFIYCLIANLIFRLFWTMTYIPYTSMLTRITTDSQERSNIGGYKTIFIALAKLPVSYFVLSLVVILGAGDEASGFLYTMSIIAVIACVAFIGCYILTPEFTTANTGEGSTDLSVAQVLTYFRSNTQLWIVLAALFAASGSFGIIMQSLIYYFKYNIGDSGSAKMAFTAIAIAGLTAVPIWMYVISRTSNRFVWFLGCCIAAGSLITLYLIPEPGVWLVTLLIYFAAAGINGFLMTFLPMTADTVDYGEWKSGYRVEAMTFGFLSLANKLSIGVAGWLLGMLQTWIGFVPNVEQSAATLQGLKGIMTLTPFFGFILSALIILRYRIDPQYHRMILEETAAAAKP